MVNGLSAHCFFTSCCQDLGEEIFAASKAGNVEKLQGLLSLEFSGLSYTEKVRALEFHQTDELHAYLQLCSPTQRTYGCGGRKSRLGLLFTLTLHLWNRETDATAAQMFIYAFKFIQLMAASRHLPSLSCSHSFFFLPDFALSHRLVTHCTPQHLRDTRTSSRRSSRPARSTSTRGTTCALSCPCSRMPMSST